MSESWGCMNVSKGGCGGACFSVTVRLLCMYTGNHLCLTALRCERLACVRVWVCMRRQSVCLYEIARLPTQEIIVKMSLGQHSWAVFISACSPSLFFIFLSPLLFSPLSTHVCIVEESDVCVKCVCIQFFEEEVSLCTFSVLACTCERTVCYVRQSVLCGDIWVEKTRTGVPAVGTSFSKDGAALQSS